MDHRVRGRELSGLCGGPWRSPAPCALSRSHALLLRGCLPKGLRASLRSARRTEARAAAQLAACRLALSPWPGPTATGLPVRTCSWLLSSSTHILPLSPSPGVPAARLASEPRLSAVAAGPRCSPAAPQQPHALLSAMHVRSALTGAAQPTVGRRCVALAVWRREHQRRGRREASVHRVPRGANPAADLLSY